MHEKEKYILEMEGVSKSFDKSNFMLDDISIKLPYGVIVGLVGENGNGKTTMIKCILNLLKVDRGEIKLFGEKPSDAEKLKNDIGVVFDSNYFAKTHTPRVINKVMTGIYENWNKSQFESYLCKFKIPMEQSIRTFSKGMLTKLSLSVALSHSPKLLILDEVTSGLDPIAREEVLETLMDFIQDEGNSVIFSSHITSDLEKIADYIIFICNGKVFLSISKEKLLNNYWILRCSEKQFKRIESCDIVAFLKKEHQIDVLIFGDIDTREKYRDIISDRVDIEEMLTIISRGEKYAWNFIG